MDASASGDANGCSTLELPLSFHNASSGGTGASSPDGRRRLLLDDTRLAVTPIASPSAGGGGSAATIEHLRGLASAECHKLPTNDNQKVMVTTAADPDRHLILIVEARAGSNKGEL